MPSLILNDTYGAAQLSSFISAALFGFTFLQAYNYFVTRAPHDKLPMKLSVSLLWFVDCMQVVFLVWAVYWYLVQNYFFPSALTSIHWTIPIAWIFAGVASFIAEGLFIPQIWILSSKIKLLVAIITLATLGQFVSSIVVFVHMISRLRDNIVDVTEANRLGVIMQQVFAIISNTTITAALCVFNYRPSQGLLGGEPLIEGFFTLLIDRGLLSAITQVVYLFVYACRDQTLLWLPFHVLTSKLLVNAVLAILNTGEVKERKENVGFTLSHLGARASVPMANQGIIVTTKTILDSDAQSLSSKGDIERGV
ncbi:hypothetical protein K439DRAFT_1641886 [Ramaria rubella]|nr:hypothetical protein K439DRAFT_1641885 [Ramaria rubella]KAF8574881.1 hypothetical protein K439DRAFT_1641886 [Ramaria rubella]